jgi:hypothetical protein
MGSAITKIVFQPPDATYTKDPNLIWLHTSEHEVIPAFFIDRDAKFTLLFSHGNAEDLGMIIQYFREVSHILEVNIFAYEYTGYGMSTGEPYEMALYADIEAAFKYLRDIIPWTEDLETGMRNDYYDYYDDPYKAIYIQSAAAGVCLTPDGHMIAFQVYRGGSCDLECCKALCTGRPNCIGIVRGSSECWLQHANVADADDLTTPTWDKYQHGTSPCTSGCSIGTETNGEAQWTCYKKNQAGGATTTTTTRAA